MIKRINSIRVFLPVLLLMTLLGQYSLAALPYNIEIPYGYAVVAGQRLRIGAGSSVQKADLGNVASIVSGYNHARLNNMILSRGAVIEGEVHSYGRIASSSDVEIHGQMIWAQGNLSLGNNVIANSVYSTARLSIGRNSTIKGFAKGEAATSIHQSSRPASEFAFQPAMSEPQPVFLPSLQESRGIRSRSYSRRTENILDPGVFGRVRIAGRAEAFLSAGYYTFNRFYMGRGSVLTVDTTEGDVVMEIARIFGASSRVTINVIGDNELYIISGGNIIIGRYGSIEANLIADRTIRVSSDTQIKGVAYSGGDTVIGNRVSVQSTAVPEPTTLLLLLCALPFFLKKFRLR